MLRVALYVVIHITYIEMFENPDDICNWAQLSYPVCAWGFIWTLWHLAPLARDPAACGMLTAPSWLPSHLGRCVHRRSFAIFSQSVLNFKLMSSHKGDLIRYLFYMDVIWRRGGGPCDCVQHV